MNDLDLAMAEFLAKNSPVVCDPVLSEKQAKDIAKANYKKRIEKEREDEAYERAERNAENLRYDSEGFYHVGGPR